MAFEDAGDVGQVLLALAGSPRWIEDRPNLSLENVLEASDGEAQAQDVATSCSIDERCGPGIGLNLDPQVRPGRGKVETVVESLHDKTLAQQGFSPGNLVYGNDQIEVQAHDRVRIGIDGLAPYHAKPYPVVGQEGNQPVEEIDLICHDRLPES